VVGNIEPLLDQRPLEWTRKHETRDSQNLGLRQVALGDQLDRDLAAQPGILRSIDFAQTAGANLLQYLVWTELCSLRHCRAPRAGNDCKSIVLRKFTSVRPAAMR
jgi:hypothetical protein